MGDNRRSDAGSGWRSAASFVAGFLCAVGTWLVAGDGAWGPPDVEVVTVPVHEARIDAEGVRLELVVGSCQGAPRARVDHENDVVEVEVTAFVTRGGGDDCLDALSVSIPRSARAPAPTEILDRHNGEVVTVEHIGP